MVTSLGVNIGQLGWQKFDVTSVVMEWYAGVAKTQKDKLTLLVDCTGCGLHVHVSTFGHSNHDIGPSLNTQGEITREVIRTISHRLATFESFHGLDKIRMKKIQA